MVFSGLATVSQRRHGIAVVAPPARLQPVSTGPPATWIHCGGAEGGNDAMATVRHNGTDSRAVMMDQGDARAWWSTSWPRRNASGSRDEIRHGDPHRLRRRGA